MAFVRNAWYVAGWSKDFGDALRAITITEVNMVLFRASDGALVALEDRCPHRLLPLSKGKRIGDTVQCGYHGMTFGRDGKCVRVPGQDNLPASAYVDTYPVHEAHGIVWVWPGEAAMAGKHLRDDAGRGHLVEDQPVDPVPQQLEPGPQPQLVAIGAFFRAEPFGARQDAIEEADAVVNRVEADGRMFADRCGKIEIGLFRQSVDPQLEILADRFRAGQPVQNQSVRAERRRQLADACLLQKRSAHRTRVAPFRAEGSPECRLRRARWEIRAGIFLNAGRAGAT